MKLFMYFIFGIMILSLLTAIYSSQKSGEYSVTVTDKHIDHSTDDGSHYMVTTDKGVFEVDNGPFIDVWNADEIYGNLHIGKKYNIKTKGIKAVNMFAQWYPYITAYEEAR